MAVHVVLFEPEIPQNTGNILRTCVATKTRAHIIKPVGFDLSPETLKRSASNHLDMAEYMLYENFEDFESKNPGTYFYMTRYGKKPHSSFDFASVRGDIYLIFGKESTGIPYERLRENLDRCFRIPMAGSCRSLNLSNAVAIALYEVMRQLDYPDLSMHEVQKGEDFLESFDLRPLGRKDIIHE
ncbi:MAG: tRNA (cytidine(34)-2'-O)-methyltransferase [Clostridiales bacterium]|nr:tRNA (cytidine(34)-2'-O)-methyltransferase [Clostridiales bacterium]MBR5974555.1 tRNA (cytidine(34)-2'-O)-methyltransferase [Clostridiales bacterium]